MIDFEKELFIIAEIGGNHEGDFDYAKKLLLDAAESGANAVKFQTYRASKIVSKVENEDRWKHFQKFELTDEQFIELAKLAKENNIMFMSSVWDLESLELLDPYIEVHKIGSGDVTNYPMLEAIAKKDKPMVISTAMSTMEDIKETVAFIESVNPRLVKEKQVILLHCVAMYGDPKDEYTNLLAIKTMQENFDLPIGYSDHTNGIYAAELAFGMGIKTLEIHFTDDKTREFRDHYISITKEEMKELVEKAKRAPTILGTGEKKPVEAIETKQRIWEFRRALYFKEDAAAGTVVTKENITSLRPEQGLPATKFLELLGKKLKVDKKAFAALSWDDFE